MIHRGALSVRRIRFGVRRFGSEELPQKLEDDPDDVDERDDPVVSDPPQELEKEVKQEPQQLHEKELPCMWNPGRRGSGGWPDLVRKNERLEKAQDTPDGEERETFEREAFELEEKLRNRERDQKRNRLLLRGGANAEVLDK